MSPHEQTLLESILDNTDYLRTRVDTLEQSVGELRVQVEHRVTRLEGKASLIALFVSALVSIAAAVITK